MFAGIVAVVVVAALVATTVIRVPAVTTAQTSYNRHLSELTGEQEVGQLFESTRPYLSGVALQIATFCCRENTRDVIFELRSRPESRSVLRTVTVNARVFGDHQLYTFAFEPIADSAGKTFYASLRSPDSVPGNAITVDYQNDDPYRKGVASAMVVLTKDRDALSSYDGTVKTHADMTFALVHRLTLKEFLRVKSVEQWQQAWQALRADSDRAWRALLMAVASVVLAVVTLFSWKRAEGFLRRPYAAAFFLLVIVLLGLGLRLTYVRQLPYTNDEGTYLYDAATVLRGRLPGGDALAKAPLHVGALALGITLFGNALQTGRLVSVIFGILTAWPLFSIGRRLGGSKAGVTAAVLWLLAASPALFSAYGHTQPLQMFFAAWAVAVYLAGLSTRRRQWILASGLLLGVSIVARKSSMALGLPLLVVTLAYLSSWRHRLAALLTLLAGCVVVLTLFLAGIFTIYGATGVAYATGLNLVRTSFEQLGDRGDLYATYSVKGILPFFRESLPLIFLALLSLGWGAERALTRFGWLIGKAGWLLPLLLAWRGAVFLARYEEAPHFSYGLWPFWIIMTAAIAALAFLPRTPKEVLVTDRSEHVRHQLLLPALWFLAVVIFYAFWIKFHANYLIEFLPALVLLAALGGQWLTGAFARARAVRLSLAALLIWSAYASAQLGLAFPHTGTFHWSSLREAAAYLREHVPADAEVLTGAVMVPYLSGHRVPFDVGHPTWYGYGFIEPELRNVFMASSEQMVDAVAQRVNWVVMENLTRFSYIREYADIERTLEEHFSPVVEIENPSNTITVLQRTR